MHDPGVFGDWTVVVATRATDCETLDPWGLSPVAWYTQVK